MSLGGRDEVSPAVIVYGPDGKAYGSPADARAAGVDNATMSPPAGFPISYPGRQPYTSAPLPSIPAQSSGGRNRYAEIMSQYRQSQPYSFFGYPQSYTGGYSSAPSSYTGGFTPYERLVAPQPIVNPVEPTVPMVGGGGGGGRSDADREGPSAFSQMTPAERAAYYAERPIQASLALGMQDLFGNVTLLGNAAKYSDADGWYDSRLEKMGVNPTISLENQNTLAGTSMQNALNALNPSGGFISTPDTQAVQNAINNTDFSGMDRGSISAAPSTPDTQAVQNAINNTDFSGMDRGGSQGGGGYGGGGDGAAGRGEPGGDRGGWGRGGGYAKGGHVSMQRLQGPNPAGPDDGYAALKDGEYVINDKAVKKYGIELMEAINSGKISKGKLRGLLEM